MANKIIQETLEKERKIKELNSVLVGEFDKAIKTGNVVEAGQNVVINFNIHCIPENLRDLLNERLNVLWGEISNNEHLEERKYFYCRGIKIDGNNVTAKLIRNW